MDDCWLANEWCGHRTHRTRWRRNRLKRIATLQALLDNERIELLIEERKASHSLYEPTFETPDLPMPGTEPGSDNCPACHRLLPVLR